MFAIVATDGELTSKNIKEECVNEKWISIASYKEDNNTIIPVFYNEKDAMSFFARNLPKNWIKGTVNLTSLEIDWIKNKGWEIEEMKFPKKMKIKFEVEILELANTPNYIETKLKNL
ncbi:MAG: hypothetical protein WCG45_05470 [bacterium]